MKYESEFRSYLSDVRKSSKTMKAYSPKVITDLLRRCRKVEELLSLELSNATAGEGEKLHRLCEVLRQARLGSTPTNPYAYLDLVNAVRIYADFLSWRAESKF